MTGQTFDGWGGQRWAIHLTKLLNAANPPNRYRFDVAQLALETTRSLFPSDPIVRVVADELDGLAGALVPAKSGKRWGVLYDRRQSNRRARFTIAHELGHYLLHRHTFPKGINSDEAAVDGRTKIAVERDANDFASTLLMPLDDFRRHVSPRDWPNFDALSQAGERYNVSLTAAVLRWLRFTERRAMLVVSVDGYVKWAWSSQPAFRSGCFISTSRGPIPVPADSQVGKNAFTAEAKNGVDIPAGVWLPDSVREFTFRSKRYDLNYTLLHIGGG
jgi:hypothetical protein